MLVSGFLLEQSRVCGAASHPKDAHWAPAVLHLSWVQEPGELRFNTASNERVDGVAMSVRTDVALRDQ